MKSIRIFYYFYNCPVSHIVTHLRSIISHYSTMFYYYGTSGSVLLIKSLDREDTDKIAKLCKECYKSTIYYIML